MATITEAHARIQASVWQAVAQSKLDLSALPKEQAEALVALVSEAALSQIDSELEKIVSAEQSIATSTEPTSTADDDENPERVLWEGRPFMSVVRSYRITTERIRITDGLFSKDREDIELLKIQDIDQKQTFSERILNIGDITIRSHDPSNPTVVLHNVSDVKRVHEILRRAMIDARKAVNFGFREQM